MCVCVTESENRSVSSHLDSISVHSQMDALKQLNDGCFYFSGSAITFHAGQHTSVFSKALTFTQAYEDFLMIN